MKEDAIEQGIENLNLCFVTQNLCMQALEIFPKIFLSFLSFLILIFGILNKFLNNSFFDTTFFLKINYITTDFLFFYLKYQPFLHAHLYNKEPAGKE